jgi:hypothetical protein
MIVELGDDATYPMRGFGFISIYIPLGHVHELSDILLVPSLRKNLLSSYYMTYVNGRVSF